VGFDRAKGVYVNDWIDSWSTGIMSLVGHYDPSTRTMDWRGSFFMPSQEGAQEMPAHHIIKTVDDDTILMEFWETDPATGQEHKGGEITYRRRK